MDILAKVLIDRQEVLVHIEFQVSRESASEIVKRKVGYIGRCYEKYGKPILSYTVYIGENAGSNDPGKYSQKFPGHNIEIEYQVIHLSKFDGESIFEMHEPSLMAFTPLMKRPDDVSAVEWIERVLSLELDSEVQSNLLLWQWILSGLIVDLSEIEHLMEETMIESSTYRYILQKGIEQGRQEGIEEGRQQTTVENILNVLDARFRIGTEQTLQLSLEGIEDMQRLKVLLRTAAQAENLASFMRTLVTNGK